MTTKKKGVYSPDGSLYITLTDGSGNLVTPGVGTGDTVGPSSSTDNAITRFDSTTGKLLQNSTVTLGDTGIIAGVPSITHTGGVALEGTNTNDLASTGYIGEIIESNLARNGSVISLTSGTPANIVSVSLTPGDWTVWGAIGLKLGATTVLTVIQGAVNPTSANIPSLNNNFKGGKITSQMPFTTGAEQFVSMGQSVINVSTTTTYYLVVSCAFTTSTVDAYGYLGARRMR